VKICDKAKYIPLKLDPFPLGFPASKIKGVRARENDGTPCLLPRQFSSSRRSESDECSNTTTLFTHFLLLLERKILHFRQFLKLRDSRQINGTMCLERRFFMREHDSAFLLFVCRLAYVPFEVGRPVCSDPSDVRETGQAATPCAFPLTSASQKGNFGCNSN